MADKILTKVFKKGMLDEDVKALRLYLEATGFLGVTYIPIIARVIKGM